MTFDQVNSFQTAPGEPAFDRWRPRFHLMAPRGWLNDPCAPFYDSVRKRYHLFYQWNPKGTDWGNMSWGHSVSNDLVNWSNVPPKGQDDSVPALAPDMDYDKDGVFTGCWCPVDVGKAIPALSGREDALGVYYTSVGSQIYLEDGTYQRGSETLSFAYSIDGGVTWAKHERNPFVDGPPGGLTVTGWRDPFAAPLPRLDQLLGRSAPHVYAVIAGGVADVGPTFFLYSFPVDKPLEWKYEGMPIHPDTRHPTSVWAGLPGFNWEVGNFFTLSKDHLEDKDFFITGAQYKDKDVEKLPSSMRSWIKPDCPGFPIWMSGRFTVDGGKVGYDREATGMLDYGWYYAANSFEDPITGRRILWGWILDNDLSSARKAHNGWAGCMAIPRVLSRQVIPNVTSPVSPGVSLGHLDNFVVSNSSTSGAIQTFTLETLDIRTIEESRKLWQEKPVVDIRDTKLSAPGGATHLGDVGKHWRLELELEMTEPVACQLVISMRHSPGFEEVTDIVFNPAGASLNVVRNHSTLDREGVNTCTEYGSFTLFNLLREDGKVRPERLRLTVICDNSVVEVFANDRFALSTKVFPTRDDALGLSMGLQTTNGRAGDAVVKSCTVLQAV